jgi:hypothetical protein
MRIVRKLIIAGIMVVATSALADDPKWTLPQTVSVMVG